jgi:hypothetical protein
MTAARERAQSAQHATYQRLLWHTPVAEFAKLPPLAGDPRICRTEGCEAPVQYKGTGRPPHHCPAHEGRWAQWNRRAYEKRQTRERAA